MNSMDFLQSAGAVGAIVIILIGSAQLKQYLRQYVR